MVDKSLHPIYTRYMDRRGQKKRLSVVLKECEEFDSLYTQHNEENAKSALANFFDTLLKEKPDKRLKIGRSYYSFYFNLLPLRRALIEKKYALACHELLTLCACEPYLQSRIYVCLVGIYRDYLEEQNDLEDDTEKGIRKKAE